jgi:hypothetical protein
MNYVTFRIKETKDGEFVLYLHNHAKNLVAEQCRSRNLDEVVDKLKKGMNYRTHFNNALGNYTPVFRFMDELEARFPDAGAEAFPDGWTDPLELYGQYRKELMKLGADLDRERSDLQELLDKHGPEWVWQYRLKLAAERVFIRDF